MTFFKRFYLLLSAAALLISGCRKSSNANWDVDAVLPVVNSVLNIKNFIGDTIFKADQGGLLHLVINKEVAALKLDSLLQIPDTILPLKFGNTSPIPLTLDTNGFIPTNVSDMKFNLSDGIKLKTAIIREGKLKIRFSNDLTQSLDLVYTLAGVTKDGRSLVISERIPPGQFSLEKYYDLAGYTLNLRGSNNSSYNTLAQTCSVTLAPHSNSVVVDPEKGAKAEVSYTKIIPQFVEGYFGRQKVKLPADTADINLIQNFSASNFMLSDATMDFTLINEFGVDFSGSFSGIKAINTTDQKTVLLNTNQLSNVNIDRATRVGNTVTSKSFFFPFNKGNSNVTSFISALPDKLSYSGQIQMNPVEISPGNGNVSGFNDFAFYNTGLRILANIDIPMKFTADYFSLTSRSAIDFSGSKALEGVNSGRFVVYASNGFPFSAKVQGYMYDAQDKLIDSVFVPGANVIARGELNGQNEVTNPTRSTIYIPISKSKIDNLSRCKKLKLVSLLLMPPNPPEIKIFEKYEIGINITAEVNYNVDIGR